MEGSSRLANLQLGWPMDPASSGPRPEVLPQRKAVLFARTSSRGPLLPCRQISHEIAQLGGLEEHAHGRHTADRIGTILDLSHRDLVDLLLDLDGEFLLGLIHQGTGDGLAISGGNGDNAVALGNLGTGIDESTQEVVGVELEGRRTAPVILGVHARRREVSGGGRHTLSLA